MRYLREDRSYYEGWCLPALGTGVAPGDKLIVSVDALLGNLQGRGIITLAERRALAHEWVKDYVRGRLPALYRDKNAHAIDRLGWFLRASC